MPPTSFHCRERRLLLILALVAMVYMLGDATTAICDGALHLAPLFALLVPLLLGRYLGEDLLDRLRGRRRGTVTRRPPVLARHRRHRAALRPTLEGLALAIRPPPAISS